MKTSEPVARRAHDEYWEMTRNAPEQGYTEQDPSDMQRPGASNIERPSDDLRQRTQSTIQQSPHISNNGGDMYGKVPASASGTRLGPSRCPPTPDTADDVSENRNINSVPQDAPSPNKDYGSAHKTSVEEEEDFIRSFSEDLVQKLAMSGLTVPEDVFRISKLLPKSLEAFALQLGHSMPSPNEMHLDAMFLIHKNRG
jgi:hypothetical protein